MRRMLTVNKAINHPVMETAPWYNEAINHYVLFKQRTINHPVISEQHHLWWFLRLIVLIYQFRKKSDDKSGS